MEENIKFRKEEVTDYLATEEVCLRAICRK